MNANPPRNPSPDYEIWLRTIPTERKHRAVRYATRIKRLIQLTGAETLLDYACGEQSAYEKPVSIADSPLPVTLQDYWDITAVNCYDPRLPQLQARPASICDGAICTGALSDAPLADAPWLLDEIFAYANSFVFIAVDCTTIRHRTRDARHAVPGLPEWWRLSVIDCAKHHPSIAWELITLSRLPRSPQVATVQSIFTSLSSSGAM